VAGSFALFGSNERSARAVPVLFAIAGLLATYAATRRIYGRAAGLFAALVLGTSLFYFALGRFLILDMAVSVCMSATLFCFLLGVREAHPRPEPIRGLRAGAGCSTGSTPAPPSPRWRKA